MTSETARRRFTEQVLPHLDDAYSLARWLAGGATDAEDIVQDACLRALQGAGQRVRWSSPRAWLLAIVRNAAFTWLAKNRPSAIVLAGGAEEVEAHPDALETPAAPSPEAALIAAADRASVTPRSTICQSHSGRHWSCVRSTVSPTATFRKRQASRSARSCRGWRARGRCSSQTWRRRHDELDHEDRLLLLHAALDGELDAAGAIEMERMLAADPELAAEYARLTALRKAVRAHAPRAEAPASLRARVLASIEDENFQLRRPRRQDGAIRHPGASFAAAIAATVVLTIGLNHLVATMSAPDAAMQSIVSAHMRSQISGQPVDVISSDRHTVKPWLASKLPVAAVVVDLASEGFPLLGGRIDIVAGAARRRSYISAASISFP